MHLAKGWNGGKPGFRSDDRCDVLPMIGASSWVGSPDRRAAGGLMKKSRFTEEQKIAILQQAAAGAQVRELCRKHGMTEQTFYRWRGKCDGLQVSDARRLRALEDENRRLKKLVADLALDNAMLKDVVGREW
jgi:putative transposase